MSATRDAHRYWNKAKGGYSCKFVPFAYVFTKSETKEVFEFAHKTLRWTASELIGVLRFAALVSDASTAIRGWLAFVAPATAPAIATATAADVLATGTATAADVLATGTATTRP